MTSSDVRWVEDENIILETMPPDFNPHEEIVASAQKTTAILNQAAAPVPYIIDLRVIELDFGELTAALAELTRDPQAAYRHQNMKELLVVSENPLIKIGAKALTADQYGSIKTRMFESMDEALTYARSIAP